MQSNIYDRPFLRKQLTTKTVSYFRKKYSSQTIQLGSKYASSINHQLPPVFHNSGILIYVHTLSVICSHERVGIL